MTELVALDDQSAAIVASQLATGQFREAADVVREALSLMDAVEQRRAALDESIMRGIADADAGRVYDLDEALDEVLAHLATLPDTDTHGLRVREQTQDALDDPAREIPRR